MSGILKFAKVAEDYYNGLKALSCAQGWEKYVVTDGEQCAFVKAAYEPAPGEVVFHCMIRNRKTMCELYKVPAENVEQSK